MVVALVASVLWWGAAGERGPAPTPRSCARAVLVDGQLRCDEELPSEVGALCPRPGPEAREPIAAGDAFDSAQLCARSFASPGEPGWSRMPADQLAALQQPVDVNRASLAELTSLPRIGPALARRIVHGRPFEHLESLVRVRGIGPATVERLRGRAFVRPPSAGPPRGVP